MDNYYDYISNLRLFYHKKMYSNEIEGNKELSNSSLTYLKNKMENLNKKQIIEENENVPIFNEIDNLIYKKYWHKLKSFHQKEKIREYVENLKINNEKKKNNLLDKLYLAVDKKILTKKGNVDYDPFKCSINSIQGLIEENGEYIFE